MKNTIVLFFSLLVVGVNAQNDSFDKYKWRFVIGNEKMNVLYVGIDNPISVAAFNMWEKIVPPEKLKLSGSSCCTIIKKLDNQYIVNVEDWQCKEVMINIGVQDGTKLRSIGSYIFRVKNLPKPTPKFGTIMGATAKALQLANTSILCCGLGSEFAFEGLNYTISKYSLVVSPKDTSMKAKFFTGINGNRVTEEIKAALSDLMPGDMISIFGIEAQGPNKIGVIKGLAAIVITVE